MTEPKITIHAAPGMSEEQIGRIAAQHLDYALRVGREPLTARQIADCIMLSMVVCINAAILAVGIWGSIAWSMSH